jgi:hypothetical protein
MLKFYTFFYDDFSTTMFSMLNYREYNQLCDSFRYKEGEFSIKINKWKPAKWSSGNESDPEDEDVGLMVFTQENAYQYLRQNNKDDNFTWIAPVYLTEYEFERYCDPENYYGMSALRVRRGTCGALLPIHDENNDQKN